jgi:hypothetical protein
MSILDDAIREHLELKRAHGADAAELKKLEDEAFGPPTRPEEPDPLAEAPTEFMATEAAVAEEAPRGRRVPNIADLQEAPEPPKEEAEQPGEDFEEPAEEEHPAMEHEAVPDPDPPPEPAASHSTGEREEIAEQPTQHFDVEAEMENGGEVTSPSDEELIDAEMSEPRLAPVDPLAAADAASAEPEIAEEPAAEEEEDDDFFSEQRLSDELSQALDTPIEGEPELPQTDEHAAAPPADEQEPGEPDEEAEEYEDDDEPQPAASDPEDVLEDTPEFLEDAEDDDLWFEQRPPKDFDFDD